MFGWIRRILIKRRRFERRRYPRVKTANLAKLSELTSAGDIKLCNLVDLSEGGVQLKTPIRLDLSAPVNLQLNLVEKGKQISVLGRIVWTGKFQKDVDQFRTGIKFSGIGADDRSFIRDYVRWMRYRLRSGAVFGLLALFFRLIFIFAHPNSR